MERIKIEPRHKFKSEPRPPHVQFDERKLSHSEPFAAVSEWQAYNDVTGAFAMSIEEMAEEAIALDAAHGRVQAN